MQIIAGGSGMSLWSHLIYNTTIQKQCFGPLGLGSALRAPCARLLGALSSKPTHQPCEGTKDGTKAPKSLESRSS